MAHNVDTMMYTGARPWHGLGTELQHAATAATAIKAAKLAWHVGLQPIYLKSGKTIPGFQATVREDSKTPLGIVRMRYQPIQNAEAFEFFDAVIGKGKAVYHTAGSLGHGEQIWILAKLPNDLIVKRAGTAEHTEKFLLLSNHHDACGSMRMFYTPVRVVCQNTLNMAMDGAGGREGVCIRHTGVIRNKVAEAQRLLGIAVKYYDDMSVLANALVAKPMTVQTTNSFVEKVFPTSKTEPSTRLANIRQDVVRLIDQGRGNTAPGIHGTAWAALNGVIEFVDYNRTPRGETPEQQAVSRLESIWFGSGAEIKARAWDVATALVGKN